MAPAALCKSYCAKASVAKQCARVDCMACESCRHLPPETVAAAAEALAKADNISCISDGSFTIPEATNWPAPYHFLDDRLASRIQSLVGTRQLLDIGAGSGQYGAFFERRRRSADVGVPLWSGVDGAENIELFTSRKGPPGARVRFANLCDPALRLPTADWVMSLEVGEHLPSSCLATYSRLLSRTAREGLLLSWAHPHQGGKCHINTRTAEWVEQTFGALGWSVDRHETAACRAEARYEWLRHNVFVFRPKGSRGTTARRREFA